MEYDSYANEFNLGRKRIFVAPEMLEDLDGNPVFDENDTVFYQLPEDMMAKENPIKEVNMELRAEDHSKAINDDLNFLSFKSGFGTERYKFDKGTVTTATQVISENSDMYRTIKKHEIILEDVIKDLIMIIISLGIKLGVQGLSEEVEIKIDFDDSIIEDKQSERQQDRQDVSMGAMRIDEYRAKWYGEPEEIAKKNLPEQAGVIE
jgi:A118 family predicted phage portal protein